MTAATTPVRVDPNADPLKFKLALGTTAQPSLQLSSTFLAALSAATAGGSAVDDYFKYRTDHAQSLQQLFADLAVTPFAPDIEGDGSYVMFAQSGDAAARVRVDVLSQESVEGEPPGSVKYTCSGTVSMLSGTDMHTKTTTIMAVTSVGVGALIAVMQAIGVQAVAQLFTCCINAGLGIIASGGAVGMEAGVQMAVVDAAGAELAAEAGGEAAAIAVAAGGMSAAAFAGPAAAVLGLIATLLTSVLQKTMVHWVDVYNLTGVDLTVTQPWSDGASFGLKPQPNVIPKVTIDAAGNHDVSYSSYMSQNSSGYSGYSYMIDVSPATTTPTPGAGHILATFNIPYGSDNSMALEQTPPISDYQAHWDGQTRQELKRLTIEPATVSPYKAVLVMNALSGSDDRYSSVLYIIDPALFPNFVPASA